MIERKSLSIFFPCFNDKGTIGTMVRTASSVAERLTEDFEIIVVDDGSYDGSQGLLLQLRAQIPRLKLIFHKKNLGYGLALLSGLSASSKELFFYTDGDGQYDVNELALLWEGLTEDVDIVNGYKKKRCDPFYRIIFGCIYRHGVKFFFRLKIRDVDCDFRLLRKKIIHRINFISHSGAICVELIKKLEISGCRFAEVGVSHRGREYNSSQFFTISRIVETLLGLFFLWIEIFFLKKNIYKS